MYEVGLGESPMQIARKLTGDPRRYRELLSANLHKSIVHVGNIPTFASLGVGEPIVVPAGWLGAAETYAQALAKVGLHPDNPDEMYKQLLLYLASPQAFKNRDPDWPGKRDNLSWWEDPKGTAHLEWPFHGGAWLDSAPKNDAQVRAVFKVPDKVPTKQWLSKMWGFPMSLAWRLWTTKVTGGFDLLKTAGSVLDAAGNFLRSIPGVKEAIKLEIDLDFAALGVLINAFVPSPGSDILHGLASVAQDTLKRGVDGLGPKPPNEIVDAILKELHFLGDANVLVRYLASSVMAANRFDAAFFTGLFQKLNDTNDTTAKVQPGSLLEQAQGVWLGEMDPTARKIVPPLSRLLVSLALTGKVNRSDLLAIVGDNPATEKVLDLFGIRDSGASPAPPPPPPKPAPKTSAPPPPKKTLAFHLGPPAPTPPPAPKKVVSLRLGPAPAAPTPAAAPAVPPAAARAKPAYEPYPATKTGALSDAPVPGSILSLAPSLFYLYRTADPSMGWTPVSQDWLSNADAQDQMVSTLTASPTARLGAYVWDGRNMTWRFF